MTPSGEARNANGSPALYIAQSLRAHGRENDACVLARPRTQDPSRVAKRRWRNGTRWSGANRVAGAVAGGNQRDIDRERARKRAEKAGVAKKTGDGNDGQLLKNKQEECVGWRGESHWPVRRP